MTQNMTQLPRAKRNPSLSELTSSQRGASDGGWVIATSLAGTEKSTNVNPDCIKNIKGQFFKLSETTPILRG